MRQFFENKKLVVVLLSVISSLSLIAFSTFGQESLPQPMTWVNDFTAMVARLISTPTNSIMQFGDSVTNLQNTYQENQQLKKQLSTLQSLEAQNTILKEENKQMTNLLKLKPTLVGKTVIAASVISRAPENWLDKLTIDVGSNNGVKENMSVMTDSGLIGRVSEVGPTSAKVSLVTSDQEDAVEIAAGVQSDDGIFYGVIDQYDSSHNRLIVNQIPKEAKIKEGNLVTTSGLGGVSPEGLIIGKVAKMEDDEFALAKRVYVEPAANFNDIRHVFVIMSQRSEPDTENPNVAEEIPGANHQAQASQAGASNHAN
ncbi:MULTISPECIES: rod shape-determining protein MreC [Aerococcus]|uniref:rod shape-determining protein MreC n=1 Tax=Aerococcus TaxID=1375 RepID=UPI00124502AC|nr:MULTISPECIES: rod shape-determining protein MreC [Aerococcus]KAA9233290.1 rod shape-determining protein MreC [Aerococcus mictus]MCY3030976.1 rod shape-determining protein MreC [Aerococcus sp. Group 1]MCY3055594.1 rod shape-determining protein MreC [Aerococcus sp. Group 1]MCY3057324.1 rod shape-determining protein MreC [Aerococcus sp. Group 1]MCY3061391.1 rod shape-determining protein MreC [Aerococcus sp. Group 1]